MRELYTVAEFYDGDAAVKYLAGDGLTSPQAGDDIEQTLRLGMIEALAA